jgi:hypothetical protein
VHFSRFGILCQEKSGNPGPELQLWAALLLVTRLQLRNFNDDAKQGDQIALIFTHWAIVYFVQFI